MADDWERARDAGVEKKQFAKDSGLPVGELNLILNREAKRRAREARK